MMIFKTVWLSSDFKEKKCDYQANTVVYILLSLTYT